MSHSSALPPHKVEIIVPGGPPRAEHLRAIGALCQIYGWDLPTSAPVAAPEALQDGRLFDDEPQSRLDTLLKDLGSQEFYVYWGGKILKALEREGLHTVRDVLVVGADFIKDIEHLGPRSTQALARALLRHFPEVPLPRQSGPAVAARFCPSLDVVTWLGLGREWADIFRPAREQPGLPFVSVQQAIDQPLADLPMTQAMRDQGAVDLELQRRFRQGAQEYATQFHAALASYVAPANL